MESVRRSVAKAISWRIFASIITSLIAWLLTGHFDVAWKIGVLDGMTKLVVYFLHERLWARVKFGLPKPPEYEI